MNDLNLFKHIQQIKYYACKLFTLIFRAGLQILDLNKYQIQKQNSQMKDLNKVLSICAIILGIYIILSYFWTNRSEIKQKNSVSNQRQEFHVGCYLQSQDLSQYKQISSKIEEISRNSWIRQTKQTSLIPTDYLHKKGVQVAQSFQNFMKQYNNYKVKADTNIQLLAAVNKAKSQFQNCASGINGKYRFSETDCLKDWDAYAKCSTEISVLKNGLNLHLSQKGQLLQKFKELLNKNPVKVSQPRHPDQDFQKKFRMQDRQLLNKQKKLEQQIKVLNQEISHISFELEKQVNDTIRLKNVYLQCSKNRMQFKRCQQLTQQIRSLGTGSLQNLQVKVDRKKISILKIKKLLNQTYNDDSSIAELKRLFQNSKQQYRKLLKLFVQTKAKLNIHCGCTQIDQRKSKEEMEKSKRQQDIRRRQLEDANLKYNTAISDLSNIRLRRRQLILDFQMNNKKLSTFRDQNRLEMLSKLERQMSDVQKQFNDHDFKCNQIKDKLSLNIKVFSNINDCLNKYQYFQEIRRKYERQYPKQIIMDQSAKIKLARSLESFRI